MNKLMFNDSTAPKINRLLGVRQMVTKKQKFVYIKPKKLIHKVIKYSVKRKEGRKYFI